MLQIFIPGREFYNERTSEFINIKDTVLKLEHSLVSVSKWEEEFKKPFLTEQRKTEEETKYYVKCMTLNNNVNDLVYTMLTEEDMRKINDYISENRTATWFTNKDQQDTNVREQTTAELIYYWMILHHIPSEYQKWHLSKLMALIEICNVKSGPSQKMSEQETIEYYKRINEERRQARRRKN